MVGKYICDSSVVNDAFECHYINLTTAQNLADIGKIGVRKIGTFIRLLRKICEEVKKLRPQLVYITPNAKGGAFYKDFVVVEMLKRMGCRVVVHYHNKGVSTRQDRWLDDKLYRRFFKGIRVILLAEALYTDVEKYVDRKDVWICPNGIPERFESDEEIPPRKNGVPRLLFLSNLLVSKGVLVLLDALTILKEKGYSFVCDFVGGETGEIDRICFHEEIERRNLEDIVVYHGSKYGKEKEAFWQNADVFVFPTFYHNECFPLVLLEAMQHGLPCIASDEGGIPDIVEDGVTGFVVEKQNVLVLADKMETLLKDPRLCLKMGEAGRKRFEEHFSLDEFERRMADVLLSVL